MTIVFPETGNNYKNLIYSSEKDKVCGESKEQPKSLVQYNVQMVGMCNQFADKN